jgi:sugar phosphate permease
LYRYVTGTASGLVNGAGSVGAVLQGALTAYIADKYGWGALFCTLAAMSAIAVVTLLASVPKKDQSSAPPTPELVAA